MKLNIYRDLEELITEKEFNFFLNNFILNEDNYSNYEKIEILDILSDKFSKFYNTHILTETQKNQLINSLILLTDFSKLDIMQDLIGILFNFRLNEYYLYLKNHCNSIIHKKVQIELLDSLAEYEQMIS